MIDETEQEAISWAQHGPLVRWVDGLWRGLGAQLGDDEFEHEDIVNLVKLGIFEFDSAGAVLKWSERHDDRCSQDR